MQKTFSIIKPDAVKRNLIGHINQMIESSNLKILASKKIYLTKNQAEIFYKVHKESFTTYFDNCYSVFDIYLQSK